MIVVTTVITMATVKMSRSMIPLARPISATISATSPLGNIPNPILHDRVFPNPIAITGSPAPATLVTIAMVVTANAKSANRPRLSDSHSRRQDQLAFR